MGTNAGLDRQPPLRLYTLLAFLAAACGGSPTESSSLTHTFLAVQSEQGDWVGSGGTYHHTVQSGTWSIEPLGPTHAQGIQQLQLHFSGSEFWHIRIAAPYGQHLRPGRYLNAEHAAFRNLHAPGLIVERSGRSCNTISGEFTIHEIRLGAGNAIERLHVEFRQSCETYMPPLAGELGVVSNPWR